METGDSTRDWDKLGDRLFPVAEDDRNSFPDPAQQLQEVNLGLFDVNLFPFPWVCSLLEDAGS